MNVGMDTYLSGILLVVLFFSAIKDGKEHIIPNVYLMRGLAVRILLLLSEVSLNGTGVLKSFGLKVALCVFIGMLGLLVRAVTGNGIGMGDIKLFMLMFLYLKVDVWFLSIFMSFILGAIWGIFRMIRGCADKKFPFAPFMMLGTLTAVVWL